MNDRRHLLKIKIKSLAAEARIIRAEERKRKIGWQLPEGEVLAQMMNAGDLKERARWLRNWRKAQRKAVREKPWYNATQAELTELQLHRTSVVRFAARASGLAYGFIRGRSLNQMEQPRSLEGQPLWKLPNHLIVSSRDGRVYEEAARLAYAYGRSGVNKADVTRDFLEWVKRRDVALITDSRTQRLALAVAHTDQPDQARDHSHQEQRHLTGGEAVGTQAAFGQDHGQPALPSPESEQGGAQ